MQSTADLGCSAWPPDRSSLQAVVSRLGILGAAEYYNRPESTLRYWANKLGIQSPLKVGETARSLRSRLEDSEPEPNLCEQVLTRLQKKPLTLDELLAYCEGDPKASRQLLEDLKDKGYQVVEHSGLVSLVREMRKAEAVTRLDPEDGVVRFAVVSDTHLGSRYERLLALHDFYRRVAAEGIKVVYHAGDLLDGHKVYKGQEWDLRVMGFDAQVRHAVDNYPREDGVTTRLIGGNHDGSYIRSGGADPLARVAQSRSDIEYLGPYSAWINVTDRLKIYMIHPDGGPAYARSYKLQKLIESLQMSPKPNVLIAGHWHEWVVMWEQNIWTMAAGCFQDQTDYMRRKALYPKVGGTIITIRLDKYGAVQSFEPRFVAYLDDGKIQLQDSA